MAAQLFLLPFRPALDANAIPVVGAKLYFYATQTSTPQPVYADEMLVTELPNPVEANAAGVWPEIYLDTTKTYRSVLRDENGSLLSEADPYVAGVVDNLAPEVAQNAALADAASAVLMAVNGGYWETSLTPPVDAANGQDFYASFGGRAILATNDGGTGVVRHEWVTTANLGSFEGANIGYDPDAPYGPDTVGAAFESLKAAAVTDKFVTNLEGATLNRLGDRVFIGGANTYDGSYPNDDPAGQDWYTQYERAQGRSNGIIVSSQFAGMTNDAPGSAIGGVFAARTSNLGPSVGGAVGLEAHVVNDNATVAHDAWALYSEATRDSEGVGAIITYEADSRNKGDYHAITPYAQHPKQSVVHQVASGGALDGTGCEDVSAGINFRHNPTKFGVGIVFGANAIRGTDGVAGYGNAILSGLRQEFAWMNSSDQVTGFIVGSCTTLVAATGIEFGDAGMLIQNSAKQTLVRVQPTPSAVNYLDVIPGAAGGSVQLLASGTDTNIALFLAPKGAGVVSVSATAMRNYADDTAAAAGGVPIGGLYHSAGDVKYRIT